MRSAGRTARRPRSSTFRTPRPASRSTSASTPSSSTRSRNRLPAVVGDDSKSKHNDTRQTEHAVARSCLSRLDPRFLIPLQERVLALGTYPESFLYEYEQAAQTAQEISRHDALDSTLRSDEPSLRPVTTAEELQLDVDSLTFSRPGRVARLDELRQCTYNAGSTADPSARPVREGQAPRPRRGTFATQCSRPGQEAGRRALRQLPRLRRLPLPGSRLAARSSSRRRCRYRDTLQQIAGISPARAQVDPPRGSQEDLPLHTNKVSSTGSHAPRSPRSAFPPGRALDPCSRWSAAGSSAGSATGSATSSRLGARRGAGAVLAGRRERLSPPPRRAAGPQHTAGARATGDRTR